MTDRDRRRALAEALSPETMRALGIPPLTGAMYPRERMDYPRALTPEQVQEFWARRPPAEIPPLTPGAMLPRDKRKKTED